MDVLGGIIQKQPLRYAGEQVKRLNSKLYQIMLLITRIEPVCGLERWNGFFKAKMELQLYF